MRRYGLRDDQWERIGVIVSCLDIVYRVWS